ncbi:hypothetical protein DSCO28_54130 [Desulfosarcina ovata subsp. sediminis]|uniref:Uncharacterized protein n=1 Tax=Desulfosarcina ovata subsp. sediminis TaxID=885957 RepID=A0A5K7ZX55_9BACT|nr:hypothetical protein [Desulfosarcina ovata]BBO84847.1 hypothetical protein DSCO28_54130 [Desulfosarcina ovata subsp. sediminis]
MDQKQMFKHMVDFNQVVFYNFFQALTLFQSQIERIANSAIDQADWIPDESLKAIELWDKSFKAACGHFRSNVDQSYEQIKKYFSG